MMVSWEDLLKGRKLMTPTVNSAHMLKCIKAVQAHIPDAKIVQIDKSLWVLESKAKGLLSNPQNSHYACWAEAAEVLRESN